METEMLLSRHFCGTLRAISPASAAIAGNQHIHKLTLIRKFKC
jgi:hypothetical protein